jgi:hypothetical protein
MKHNQCLECKGRGELDVMENVSGTSEQAPTGSCSCDNCEGTGIENNEQIIIERMIDDEEIIKKLEEYFVDEGEYRGRGITKDNCEDLFDIWLQDLDLDDIINIIDKEDE